MCVEPYRECGVSGLYQRYRCWVLCPCVLYKSHFGCSAFWIGVLQLFTLLVAGRSSHVVYSCHSTL